MTDFKILAFTHQNLPLADIGKLVLSKETLPARLMALKKALSIAEIFYVSTCNRVEFVLYMPVALDTDFAKRLLSHLFPTLETETITALIQKASFYQASKALTHLLEMSCSLDSMVVGEKEILAQLRADYELCLAAGLTADFMRLVMNSVVKTAKEVYTKTKISDHPISVASLAYRQLCVYKPKLDAKILIVGAGATNQLLAKYLLKHGFSNFTVFNRSEQNRQTFAKQLQAAAFPLTSLASYQNGFDILIVCTASTDPIITTPVYQTLLAGSDAYKIVIDLALPADVAPAVIQKFPMHYVSVEAVQHIAKQNLERRRQELVYAGKIIQTNKAGFYTLLKQRKLERAFSKVPAKVTEIKQNALQAVFAKDVDALDPTARAVLDKVVNYLEKKYISLPMVMAKNILLNEIALSEAS